MTEDVLARLAALRENGAVVAGVDEAGRGPLAGPVLAAVVILTPEQTRTLMAMGLRDSKRMSPKRREAVFAKMCELGVRWRAQAASVERIERTDILKASLWAMGTALARLGAAPDLLVVDGLYQVRGAACPQLTLVKADDLVPEVSAASVAAKVLRDHVMTSLDVLFPSYGFAKHKGYPTKQHREALVLHGLSPVHRKSFCHCPQHGTHS